MAEKKEVKATEELVKIRLPRRTKNDEDVFVSVNAKTYLIKRGMEVEVPASVAELIRNAEEMQEEMYEFQNANAK